MTTLRDEIKQTRPFRSTAEEVALNIARTAALLEHAFAERLRPHGITPTQYNALRILRGAGPDGLCRSEIGARMIAIVPDATRLLDRLEQMGLVVRGREGSDRRFVHTRLTQKGRELVDALDPIVAELHERNFGHLDEEQLRSLVELLEAARSRL